jgi:hypothetical protein
MSAWLAAGGGFLLAVLWFDLLFDVQALRARGREPLPEAVLASIAGYYRRVTTEARPMGHLVGLVMGATVLGAAGDLVLGGGVSARRALALVLCGAPVALAFARTLPNAVRLGARLDAPERQSELARAIARDHVACLLAIAGFLALELGGGS